MGLPPILKAATRPSTNVGSLIAMYSPVQPNSRNNASITLRAVA